MKVFVPRETQSGERRAPILPETVKRLCGIGAVVEIEAGVGLSIDCPDGDYAKAGATVVSDRKAAFAGAGLVLRLRPPASDEIDLLRQGCIHVSYLDPFRAPERVERLARQQVTAICMELIPRTTLAQKMDALSSQASLGGYVAVILAAARLNKILPMMMTPSGTIAPSRVFVIGAGVAGLQAIATAKRLGARVEAFDTRPAVAEQVASLGARFVKIDLGETGQTKEGYARQLTEEQLARQRAEMAKHCAAADIVITTAQVFGRKAPVIVTADMLKGMKAGSIVVDMAVETGGNVEGSVLGEEVDVGGVKVMGLDNLPGYVPVHSSQMYSGNVGSLVEHFWDKEAKGFKLNMDDEILRACLVTWDGAVVHEAIKALVEKKGGAA